MNRNLFGRSSLLACGSILFIATAALAGSGVGGVFNLGQVNSVNAVTKLQGSTATQQFSVLNNSTTSTSAAVYGQSNSGTGIWGRSNRFAVRAQAGTTGVNYGVYSTTGSYEGVAGYFRNTGSPPDLTYGTALRVLGTGATGNEIDRRAHAAGAGEFIGYVGVTGASSLADGGAGVLALNGAGDYGIYALSDSPSGQAGFFQNTRSTAVLGLGVGASLADDSPIFVAGGRFLGRYGVVGIAASPFSGGIGVIADQGARGQYALLARGNASVAGNLSVQGTLTKGSGTFKIDHPLDPDNKYLSHSFVESPDMKNVYDGIVTTDAGGKAVVDLPDYFSALNRDPRYQLTVIGSPANAYISEEVSGNRFAIQTSAPDVKVSWQITGIRQDAFALAHPVIVEEEKALADRGRYLHPVELGMPASLVIGAIVASQDTSSPDALTP